MRGGHSYENVRWQEWTKMKKPNLKPKRLNMLQNIVKESKVIMINQYWKLSNVPLAQNLYKS